MAVKAYQRFHQRVLYQGIIIHKAKYVALSHFDSLHQMLYRLRSVAGNVIDYIRDTRVRSVLLCHSGCHRQWPRVAQELWSILVYDDSSSGAPAVL